MMTREEAYKKLCKLPVGHTMDYIALVPTKNLIDQIFDQQDKLETERDKYNTIAANLQISRQKAYDNIAELEAIIEKMKSCENCESHTNVGSKCLLDMEDSLDCRTNNYSNWKLKDNE